MYPMIQMLLPVRQKKQNSLFASADRRVSLVDDRGAEVKRISSSDSSSDVFLRLLEGRGLSAGSEGTLSVAPHLGQSNSVPARSASAS